MSGSGDGHGGFRAGSGRPSSAASSSKKSPPPSRLSYQCPVCGSSKRSDKLKSHMIQLCHFDSDGKPMSIHDPRFKTLTREGREHTDYCRSKNITKDTLENSWHQKEKNRQKQYARLGEIELVFICCGDKIH